MRKKEMRKKMKEERKEERGWEKRREIAGKIYIIKELPRIGYLIDIEELKAQKEKKKRKKKQGIFQAKKGKFRRNGSKGENRD